MRSVTVSHPRARFLAFALLASLSLTPRGRGQEPFEPFPWQWSTIERKVELAHTTAAAILQNWSVPCDPRRVTPAQYALSLEVHAMVAMLELDLRYLRAELAANAGSEWYAHASEVVQRRIEVHGKRLDEAWTQAGPWHAVIAPQPVVRQQIPVLLAHLSRVEGELGLCDYWKEGRNDGSIRAVFAEIDGRIPSRVEGNLRVYKLGQPLFLRTGFLLQDGRRVDTSRRMRLDGVAGERVEDGFRLGTPAPGIHRATVVRRDRLSATLEFAVREDALRLTLPGGAGPDVQHGGRVLVQVSHETGEPFVRGPVAFVLERAGERGAWHPVPVRVAPVDRGATFELLDLGSGSYRVQARAEGFAASPFVLFEVRMPKLVLEFAVRPGGRGGFERGPGWTRFRVLADGRPVEEGVGFESATWHPEGRWIPGKLEPRTGRVAGFYVIEDAPEGRHRLRAACRGHEPSEWVEFEVQAVSVALLLGLPKKIFAYGETIPVTVGASDERRLGNADVTLAVEMISQGAPPQPCPFVFVANVRPLNFEMSGFRPGFDYRVRAIDRAGRCTPSDWSLLVFQPEGPRKVALPIVPANARRRSANVHFREGDWDKSLAEIVLSAEDAQRLAHGFELTAEKAEFLCVNLIVVEGRNARGEPRTYTFFEPLMYDVSRLAERGYATFEYVTPQGRRQGDGVYVSPNPEVPPPWPGIVWPPYSRLYQTEHAKVKNPRYAYTGTNKSGRVVEGQNGLIKDRNEGREEQGTLRFLLPEPLNVQVVRVRHQAREGTEASVKMIVEQ